MDKDQAYVRSIPKKIEIPPEDLPDVQKRNILAIKANSQNQLMVRNVVFFRPGYDFRFHSSFLSNQ